MTRSSRDVMKVPHSRIPLWTAPRSRIPRLRIPRLRVRRSKAPGFVRLSLLLVTACLACYGEGVAEVRGRAGVPPGAALGFAFAPDSLPTLAEMRGWSSAEWEGGPAAAAILQIMQTRPPTEATRWIHLLTVLDRVGPVAAPVALEAVARADEGAADESVKAVLEVVEGLEHTDQGPLLALAALLGEVTDPTGSAELRSRVIVQHPDEPEVPELRLRHARWLLSINARRDEGFAFLEDLIVDHPEHPIAPDARRLLQLERTRQSGLE